LGFPDGWLNWIAALLSSSTTRVVLNGVPGDPICHGRRLCKGDSLSPMLFLLIMEVLDSLIHKANSWNLFQDLRISSIPFHTSLYADDLVIFIRLEEQDIRLIWDIFSIFTEALGLACNLTKSQLALIRCLEHQVSLATSIFPCSVVSFPLKYLDVPLSITKLPRSAWQPLIDHITDRLPVEGHLNESGWTSSTHQVHSLCDPRLPVHCNGYSTLGVEGLGKKSSMHSSGLVLMSCRGGGSA
jgi:hypothetical protein